MAGHVLFAGLVPLFLRARLSGFLYCNAALFHRAQLRMSRASGIFPFLFFFTISEAKLLAMRSALQRAQSDRPKMNGVALCPGPLAWTVSLPRTVSWHEKEDNFWPSCTVLDCDTRIPDQPRAVGCVSGSKERESGGAKFAVSTNVV